MNRCPWCAARAIDVTTNDDLAGDDRRPRLICIGPQCHEWRDGDGPDPDPPAPLIVLATH